MAGHSTTARRADTRGELLSLRCGTCGLIRPEDWAGAPAATIATLNRRKCIRQVGRGSMLFHQGDRVDSLYRLLDGIVLLRHLDSGGAMVTPHMVSPGQTLGFRAFVDGNVHGVSAECATDVVLCHIPADVAALAFSGSHPLERAFARHVAAELTDTEDALLAVSILPVPQRLLLVFARLCRLAGGMGENGEYRLVLPLLRADIAALAGIARETFSRAMHGLEDEGWLRLQGEVAMIADVARFRRGVELIQPGFWRA